MINANKGTYKEVEKEHYLITVFDHDNFTELIELAIKNNAILFYDMKKVKELEESYRIKNTQEENQFTGKIVPNALFYIRSNWIVKKYRKCQICNKIK